MELLGDERVGEGGHLVLRRVQVRLLRADGSRSAKGSWDYVERPMGLDAVVVALWHRLPAGGVEVLLRHGVRVALHLGRPLEGRLLFPELVAGILEPQEQSEDDLRRRAALEVLEEAGLAVEPQALRRLGPALFPTPGMCPERFHFFSCEVQATTGRAPQGDGSPFEEGARLEWVTLDEALRRCASGELEDMKTELGLRRLREAIAARQGA